MKVLTYRVRANLPDNLKPLEEIAYNIWFSWNFEAVMLFIRMDYDAWISSKQNPAHALGLVSQQRLDELSQDDSFVAAMNAVYEQLNGYISSDPWEKTPKGMTVAYFSMEYGLDQCLPMYSGGLGVLSGDHLKTASDLGLPLVAVGLLYRQGYFRQYLNADGYQQEEYPEHDWYNMPVHQVLDDEGRQMHISVDLAGTKVLAGVWKAAVGKISLYLLDTNLPENSPAHRNITAALYEGDRDTRIQQEIILGVGGIHLLDALGTSPTVFHMNEGHSAFLVLERVRRLMTDGKLAFDEASRFVWSTSVFTTHTPVPAGNERFAPDFLKRYFTGYAENLGLTWERFIGLGRENPGNEKEDFCMTVLALRFAAHSNGVSKLHGKVSRRMWKSIWPGLTVDEIPISHITNGVHPRTWIAHEKLNLMDRYFGPSFHHEPSNLETWKRIDRISDEEFWRVHERRREHMVAFVRQRQGEDVLSSSVLTITVARRFATYKRSNLLLRDPERLVRLLTDNERPVQIIFGGKAHPRDAGGKELIRQIYHFSNQPEVRSRVVFMENYDIGLARYLTSGSDIWLNTPRRPYEASGTSGMKASMNGVLNLSILDGWWEEAYNPSMGWAIGGGEQYDNDETQDDIESKLLFDLLEREIIPMFYERGRDGLPREWIGRMKNAISVVGSGFASHRMLMEYTENLYAPASNSSGELQADDYALVRDLNAYLQKVRSAWDSLEITEMRSATHGTVRVGIGMEFSAKVRLGPLQPEDLLVELVQGPMTALREFGSIGRKAMTCRGVNDGVGKFTVSTVSTATGLLGFSVRLLPSHPALANPFLPGLVKWADGETAG